MKITTEYPYDEYDGYTVVNKENRKHICLVHKESKRRTTVSYARYLMAVHLKRLLESNEQVDHIDEDKTNDVIGNLQILSASDNIKKNIKSNNRTIKMVEAVCPNCNETFNRQLNKTHLQKGGKFSACSIKCVHSFLTRGLSPSELINIGNTQILRHYRK